MKLFYSTLLLTACLAANAQINLFVATTGNNNSGDGTIGNPYKTIQKAATEAEDLIDADPNTGVNIMVRQGTYRNTGFSTTDELPVSSYDPENAGEAIWKTDTNDSAVKLSNINGNSNAWIVIKPYQSEHVTIECDSDAAFSIRNCSYIKIKGFEIKGIAEKIPLELAWKYWGTYRYDNNGAWIYGDRKEDICAEHNLTSCTGIPPEVLQVGITYDNLPDISDLNVQRPNLFDGKGILVNLSHHIKILENETHHFPGGGLRVTQSDYVDVIGNSVHHNSGRASVGTHGLVVEGLEPESGNNNAIIKCTVAKNRVYSNYNELYSWVQSKTVCTVVIDEGKGLCLLRTSPSENGFNGFIKVENNICYDNGKSGIHANSVDGAIIVNNTVYGNGHTNLYNSALSGGNHGGISLQNSDNFYIANNIAVVPQLPDNPQLYCISYGTSVDNIILSNNIVYGGQGNQFGTGSVTTNPLFVNAPAYNFNLQANSPAIDAGTTTNAPADDFDSNTRTTVPDIGAYEYNATLGQEPLVNSVLQLEDIILYPNPATNALTIKAGTAGTLLQIAIYNLAGQTLLQYTPQTLEAEFTLDVSHLSSGVYFASVNGKVMKFIKY